MISVRVKANAILAIVAAGLAMLYRFPPEEYGFYPVCPIYQWLHVYCPGCGATRAVAALVHLRFTDALHYNALIMLLAPVLLVYFGIVYWKAVYDEKVIWPRVPERWMMAAGTIAVVFGVVRNLK